MYACPTVWMDGEGFWRETEFTTSEGVVLQSVQSQLNMDATQIGELAEKIRSHITKGSIPEYIRSFGEILGAP